ncbi:hypothetical protein KXW43_008201, partial [Aspergillus fumigatus]
SARVLDRAASTAFTKVLLVALVISSPTLATVLAALPATSVRVCAALAVLPTLPTESTAVESPDVTLSTSDRRAT